MTLEQLVASRQACELLVKAGVVMNDTALVWVFCGDGKWRVQPRERLRRLLSISLERDPDGIIPAPTLAEVQHFAGLPHSENVVEWWAQALAEHTERQAMQQQPQIMHSGAVLPGEALMVGPDGNGQLKGVLLKHQGRGPHN